LILSLYANVHSQPNELTNKEIWADTKIENLEIINSAEEEFSPYIWSNYLVYIAVQEKTSLSKKGPVYFDIKASLLEDSATIKSFVFNPELNSQFHEGPISWDQSSNKLFFTRGNSEDKQPVVDAQGRQLLYIYEADYAQGKWQNIEQLSFCTEEENYCHPASFNNGQSLIFASTIPGGSGKMDLYKTERITDFTWATPSNLGKQINNPDNDWFPFVYENTLFYATDLKDGKGLDIYTCKLDANGNPGPIVRLPSPINSDYDDFGLVISTDKTNAYFSSNRPGGKGKDDVYKITFNQSTSSSAPTTNSESISSEPTALESIATNPKATEPEDTEAIATEPTPKQTKKEMNISVSDFQSKAGIAEANIIIYVLPPSSANNFIQQLDAKSDIILLETMASNIASSITYQSKANGTLDLNLQDDEHLFIIVKKPGYQSEYNYINTRNSISELSFEMRK